MRASGIRVVPKSNEGCLYKRQKTERTGRCRKESHMRSETDTGVSHLWAKDHQGLLEARREVRMNSPSETPEKNNSGDILHSDFWAPEL